MRTIAVHINLGNDNMKFGRGTKFLLISLDTDALVNSTEGLEDEQTSVLNEVFKTGHQEEVIYQNLKINTN